MIITFPGMAAEQESRSISDNLRWSCRKRMEQGEFSEIMLHMDIN